LLKEYGNAWILCCKEQMNSEEFVERRGELVFEDRRRGIRIRGVVG